MESHNYAESLISWYCQDFIDNINMMVHKVIINKFINIEDFDDFLTNIILLETQCKELVRINSKHLIDYNIIYIKAANIINIFIKQNDVRNMDIYNKLKATIPYLICGLERDYINFINENNKPKVSEQIIEIVCCKYNNIWILCDIFDYTVPDSIDNNYNYFCNSLKN
jgi:hypothetical protein